MNMFLMIIWSFIIRATPLKKIIVSAVYVTLVGVIVLTYNYRISAAPENSMLLINVK